MALQGRVGVVRQGIAKVVGTIRNSTRVETNQYDWEAKTDRQHAAHKEITAKANKTAAEEQIAQDLADARERARLVQAKRKAAQV